MNSISKAVAILIRPEYSGMFWMSVCFTVTGGCYVAWHDLFPHGADKALTLGGMFAAMGLIMAYACHYSLWEAWEEGIKKNTLKRVYGLLAIVIGLICPYIFLVMMNWHVSVDRLRIYNAFAIGIGIMAIGALCWFLPNQKKKSTDES